MQLKLLSAFLSMAITTFAQDTSLLMHHYTKISQSLLYAVRTGDSSDHYVHQLATANERELNQALPTDAYKKAFWLNIYNAFTQKILSENPNKYKSRRSFFTSKQIVIAGKRLSLDDIEHGILRRSKIKWSLGYINKLFPGSFEKKFRVQQLDYRIHFALNCGARSCPPIAFYQPGNIDRQLELATRSYLKSEVEKDEAKHIVLVPKIMSWFRGDFHGKKGIMRLLKQNRLLNGETYKIRFKDYDWQLFLSHYVSNDESITE